MAFHQLKTGFVTQISSVNQKFSGRSFCELSKGVLIPKLEYLVLSPEWLLVGSLGTSYSLQYVTCRVSEVDAPHCSVLTTQIHSPPRLAEMVILNSLARLGTH